MQIIDQTPSLILGKQNDQFAGCSANITVHKATIAKPNGNKVYFLRLFGDIEFSSNNKIINMEMGITESDLGPLFVNKGKTIFGIEFLKNGAVKYKENGLFITFEETPDNLIVQARQFGIDLKSLRENNKVIIKTLPEQEKLNESIIFQYIDDAVKNHKIKRLVIDSLDSYANNIVSFEDNDDRQLSDLLWIKRAIYRLTKKLQKYSKITKILISEAEEDSSKLSKDGVSEFLCDGVIKIDYKTLGGRYSRQIKIRKMRSTKNIPDVFSLEINSKGLHILTQKKK